MTLFKLTEAEANLEVKAEDEPNHQVLSITANTVASHTAGEISLHMVKNARSAEKTINSRQCAKVVIIPETAETTVNQEGRKEKRNFMKQMRVMKGPWMTWLNRFNHSSTMTFTSIQ